MGTLKHILFVEDDLGDIELTLTTLSEFKLANKTVVVRDGVDALDYLYCKGTFAERSDGNPVVILLDLKMPRMNGIEVIRKLKTDETMKNIPIVVLTSSSEEQDLQECYKLGVNAYVVKPVRFEEFVEAIRHIGVFWAIINQPPNNC